MKHTQRKLIHPEVDNECNVVRNDIRASYRTATGNFKQEGRHLCRSKGIKIVSASPPKMANWRELLMMVQKSGVHQLRLVAEIPLFTVGFINPNGGFLAGFLKHLRSPATRWIFFQCKPTKNIAWNFEEK